MTQGTQSCDKCGHATVVTWFPPYHYCPNCTTGKATTTRELFPIVAWATKVVEDRADLFGDNDRDWLHA